MPISPARETSYRILLQVESGRAYAVDLLQDPRVSRLKDSDRRLATEITMGALRRRGELDYWLEKLSGKKLKYFDPEVAAIFRLSLYQILFLDKIPKSAVVNEAVELAKAAHKRSATGLVNAVLRKAQPITNLAQGEVKEGKATSPDAARMAGDVRCLPAWLAERWTNQFGKDAMESLASASLKVPPTTLRIAGGEADRANIQHELSKEGIAVRPGHYARTALNVKSGSVQSSALILDRRAVIQDEASQLVASLVSPRPGDRVLDLCAAPGIKTGALVSALGSGRLVACDLSGPRLRTLKRLLHNPLPPELRLFLVRVDVAHELCFGIAFDRILLDAPCSGTGTLARNPEIKWRLKPEDLLRLAEKQTKMLKNALASLAPGGRLVYSTCSLEPEENEQVVENVLSVSKGFQLLTSIELSGEFPGLTKLFDTQGYFRTRPDLHGMDGFFAAVIRHVAA